MKKRSFESIMNAIVKYFIKANDYIYFPDDNYYLISDGHAVYKIPAIYHNQIIAAREAKAGTVKGYYRTSENKCIIDCFQEAKNNGVKAHYLPLKLTLGDREALIIKGESELIFVNQAYIDLAGDISGVNATTRKSPVYFAGTVEAVILPINVTTDISELISF